MKTWIAAASLAVCLSSSAQVAWAQPAASWSGTYSVSGKQGDRETEATVKVVRSPAGGLLLTRTARFANAPHDALSEFVWKATADAPSGRTLRVVYSVASGARRRGIASRLGWWSHVTPRSAPHRFVVTYDLTGSGALSEAGVNRTPTGSEAWWRTLETTGKRFSLADVVRFLDAQAKGKPLSRLGAQWHLLRMSHWRLEDGRLRTETAANPYDPQQKHTLYLPVTDSTDVEALYDRLERSVFPYLLRLKKTRWSYEAASYHYVAAVDLAGVRFDPTESAETLEGDRGDGLYVDSTDWGTLRATYETMKSNACPTVCLAQMEDVIARGVLAGLSHADLVKAVHQDGRLPSSFGCVGKSFTGMLTHNYDMRGYVRFGSWAFVGRPLYYRAMDKRKLDVSAYQGENLILTKISDAAVADFGAMGGFGTVDNLPNFPPRGRTIDDEINVLSGVSEVIARYWKLRQAGHVAQADSSIDRPFFNETATSVGGSLGHWVGKLYSVNPRTPYKLFAYDYGFAGKYFVRVRAAAQAMPPWRTLD